MKTVLFNTIKRKTFGIIQDLWIESFRDFPFNDSSDFISVKTAFKGIDNKTYFFSEEAYVAFENGKFTAIREIKSNWGIVDNNIVQQNKIDAAFVLNNNTTFVFFRRSIRQIFYRELQIYR